MIETPTATVGFYQLGFAAQASNRIQLHVVACPCLSPHETGLLNTLAELQAGREDHAQRCIGNLMGAPAMRLVWPALTTIVAQLDERDLRLTRIDTFYEATPTWGAYTRATMH